MTGLRLRRSVAIAVAAAMVTVVFALAGTGSAKAGGSGVSTNSRIDLPYVPHSASGHGLLRRSSDLGRNNVARDGARGLVPRAALLTLANQSTAVAGLPRQQSFTR